MGKAQSKPLLPSSHDSVITGHTNRHKRKRSEAEEEPLIQNAKVEVAPNLTSTILHEPAIKKPKLVNNAKTMATMFELDLNLVDKNLCDSLNIAKKLPNCQVTDEPPIILSSSDSDSDYTDVEENVSSMSVSNDDFIKKCALMVNLSVDHFKQYGETKVFYFVS